MIDGYQGSYEKLNDKELVLQSLNELPGILGMHMLADPVVYEAPSNGKKDPGGWSGFVVIAESHISVHTFPGNGFVTIDAYTCKNGLKVDFIADYFKEKFSLGKLEINLVERGKEYRKYVME